MINYAIKLWGLEEVEKMRTHIEATASAVDRIEHIELNIETEPVIRLRHKNKI